MQCKICVHQTVCMHKQEFDRLEGMLPVTVYPFKSSVTCGCFREETVMKNGMLNQFNQKLCLGNKEGL